MSSYFTRAKDDLAYNERAFVEGRGHFVDDIIKPGGLPYNGIAHLLSLEIAFSLSCPDWFWAYRRHSYLL